VGAGAALAPAEFVGQFRGGDIEHRLDLSLSDQLFHGHAPGPVGMEDQHFIALFF
jgi:hypothetical protein